MLRFSTFALHILERYDDTGFALPYPITVLNAARQIKDATGVCGHVLSTQVPHRDDLAKAVVVVLCLMPVRFLGSEVRFIRQVFALSEADMATALGISRTDLVDLERRDDIANDYIDTLIRMLVLAMAGERVIGGHPDNTETQIRREPRQATAYPAFKASLCTADDATEFWAIDMTIAL